jgi:hypothetical protein
MSKRVTILYIGGRGRRSMLLARMRGQIPGFLNIGDLCHVWYWGFQENQLCGYKQPRIGFRPILFAWGWTKSRGRTA